MKQYLREPWQQAWSDARFAGWCAAQFCDGAFMAMNGDALHDAMPAPKQDGYATANNGMDPAERKRIWNRCTETLGYVSRYGRHWSDNPQYR